MNKRIRKKKLKQADGVVYETKEFGGDVPGIRPLIDLVHPDFWATHRITNITIKMDTTRPAKHGKRF